MMARIMLMCALGQDITDEQVPFWKNGKQSSQSVAFSLRQTFQDLLTRLALPHIFFYPKLAYLYLTPSERDMYRNA